MYLFLIWCSLGEVRNQLTWNYRWRMFCSMLLWYLLIERYLDNYSMRRIRTFSWDVDVVLTYSGLRFHMVLCFLLLFFEATLGVPFGLFPYCINPVAQSMSSFWFLCGSFKVPRSRILRHNLWNQAIVQRLQSLWRIWSMLYYFACSFKWWW